MKANRLKPKQSHRGWGDVGKVCSQGGTWEGEKGNPRFIPPSCVPRRGLNVRLAALVCSEQIVPARLSWVCRLLPITSRGAVLSFFCSQTWCCILQTSVLRPQCTCLFASISSPSSYVKLLKTQPNVTFYEAFSNLTFSCPHLLPIALFPNLMQTSECDFMSHPAHWVLIIYLPGSQS